MATHSTYLQMKYKISYLYCQIMTATVQVMDAVLSELLISTVKIYKGMRAHTSLQCQMLGILTRSPCSGRSGAARRHGPASRGWRLPAWGVRGTLWAISCSVKCSHGVFYVCLSNKTDFMSKG